MSDAGDGRARLRVVDSRGREVDAWRMCFRKCRYPNRAARKRGVRVYRCPLCRQWHLTSRRGRRKRRGSGGDDAAAAQRQEGGENP